jgi:PAS domain S-box-containing protein
VKFLIIDDNAADRELMVRRLHREFPDSQFVTVGHQQALDDAIAQGDFQIVLTDYQLHWSDGLTILALIKEKFPDVPVLMVTGTGSEEVAVEGLRSGLSNYILKKHMDQLPFAVRESLENARLRRQYDTAIEQLRASEERYRELFEQGLTAVFVLSPGGHLLTCNPAFARIFGFENVQEALQADIRSLYPDERVYAAFLARLQQQRRLENDEMKMCRRSGEPVYVIANAVGSFDEDGRLLEVKGYLFDNTERKRLEEQIVQAQKMESVGQLVSGIAHDFNNMLGGILGHSERCLARVTETHPLYEGLYHIREIAQRAARVTRQLLAFSRRQVLEQRDLDVNVVIADMLNFIDKILKDQIEILFIPGPGLHAVRADATQIEQALLNLCINARDAMPEGGKLTIRTCNVRVDEAFCRKHRQAQPGEYVLLSVEDTGLGMDDDVLLHIFEPFFTTKEFGKGTGLGLAMVHGIVGQHNGFIDVRSKMGEGTTFDIYLPSQGYAIAKQDGYGTSLNTERAMQAVLPVSAPAKQQNGHRPVTILVVEDDPDLRYLMEEVLRDDGYSVVSAGDGEEGLLLFQQNASFIALVVADVVTPKMKGKELHEHVRKISPLTRFLFVSGYEASQLSRNFVLESGINFLQKPFDLDELVAKVREVLG